LKPCAIAGAGKLPAAETAAVAPSSRSRRRFVIAVTFYASASRLWISST
jgi:hypothetical protein